MKRQDWMALALLTAGLLLTAAGVIALGVELAALGVVNALGGEEGGNGR